MAWAISTNRKYTSAVLHFTSNATITVAGNSSQSNIAMSDETLTGVSIVQAFWGTDGSGHIHIKRGANLVCSFDSTGYKDFAGSGMPVNLYPDATIDVVFAGTNNYLMIEVQKMGSFSSNSDYFKI